MTSDADPAPVVIDASAVVDLLLGGEPGERAAPMVAGCALHAPAHLDAEVLSALGRLVRDDAVDAATMPQRLSRLRAMPLQRHPLGPLLDGAWQRRHNDRLLDGLYVELAVQQRWPLVTTDGRLARGTTADIVVVTP